jgi:IS30 family transposase
MPYVRSGNEVYTMSDKIQTNQKHMNQDNRIVIEKGLDSGASLRAIAREIGKDPTTIAKEVKKHRIFQEHNKFNAPSYRCDLAKDCHRKNVCSTVLFCNKECKRCNKCHSYCSDYKPFDYHCPKTDRAPFVCNGCSTKTSCHLDKFYYRATAAQREYKTILVESRTGINITEEQRQTLDATVSPLVQQGQSVYTILQNHPEITQCEKTIYNYIDSGVLSVGNLDLPKKVKYKPRSIHGSEITDTGIFEGRSYKDYEAYLKEYPDTRITEMDTVVGPVGSRKALLTLHFCSADFMMAYLLGSKESGEVERIFDVINNAVGTQLFSSAMPLILTDRGGEFKHPDALECGTDNILRTNIYYCDPLASWQKPHCEKNHEYIRKICPKGVSTFDRLTQEDVNLMMSHINSSCRQSLGGLTPFALAKLMLPAELLDFFALTEIPADDVILTPSLLKGKIEINKCVSRQN